MVKIMTGSPKLHHVIKAMALMTTLSSYFIGSIVLGVFVGMWADNYFGSGGIFLFIGFILGLAMAVMGIYIAIRRFLGGGSRE